MTVAREIKLTADDYRAMPEGGPRYQLIEGKLYMAPAPNRFHQDISMNLEFILRKHLEKHPIGKLYHAPFDVYLTEHNVFQPDILFVAKNRFDTLVDEGAHGAPTLVVEILSPGTARLDRENKRRVYAAEGVEELWLIDPPARTLELYRLQEQAEAPLSRFHENDSFQSSCFPGLTIKLLEVFRV